MKRNYMFFIKDILTAMESIENFVEGMSFEEFAEDDKTVSAVIRKFEIIGEAAKNLPESITKNNTNIAWRAMAGMRDRLIHAYFGIDLKLIWDTIRFSIPGAKPFLKSILEMEK